jgi:predicted Holliday junction resolvase-like endonuclease
MIMKKNIDTIILATVVFIFGWLLYLQAADVEKLREEIQIQNKKILILIDALQVD